MWYVVILLKLLIKIMSKLLVLIGPSGSGKSTFARKMAEEKMKQGEDVIIVGRDKLREMMFGYSEATVKEHYKAEDLGIREYKVSEVQDTIIRQAIREGKTVIVDNTHLKKSYITSLGNYNVEVECILVETSMEECIKRDSERERSVGKEVIIKQFKQLSSLKNNFDFKIENFKVEKLEKIENFNF